MLVKLVCTCPLKTRSDFDKGNVSLNCQFFNTPHQQFSYTTVLKFRQNSKTVYFNISIWQIDGQRFNNRHKTDNPTVHICNKYMVTIIVLSL